MADRDQLEQRAPNVQVPCLLAAPLQLPSLKGPQSLSPAPLPASHPPGVLREQVGAGGVREGFLHGYHRGRVWLLMADLNSRSIWPLPPPGARVLHRAPRLAPGELWLCLMWWHSFQGTAGTTPSEIRMFLSRLCGAFIKNRQINKQIAAH